MSAKADKPVDEAPALGNEVKPPPMAAFFAWGLSVVGWVLVLIGSLIGMVADR